MKYCRGNIVESEISLISKVFLFHSFLIKMLDRNNTKHMTTFRDLIDFYGFSSF